MPNSVPPEDNWVPKPLRVDLTAAELRILIEARNLLNSKLIPQRSLFCVEQARDYINDVLAHSVLDIDHA